LLNNGVNPKVTTRLLASESAASTERNAEDRSYANGGQQPNQHKNKPRL
jgi:hypothetical protein